jgi:hypothetical protein
VRSSPQAGQIHFRVVAFFPTAAIARATLPCCSRSAADSNWSAPSFVGGSLLLDKAICADASAQRLKYLPVTQF